MNTTIRNLIVALPLATAALTSTPGVAMADDGPVIVLPPPGGDPQGPVIANPTPGPGPVDHGPGDLTAPQPCPTHGVVCGGNGGNDGGPSDDGGNAGGQHHGNQEAGHEVASIALPTRIDAGLAPAARRAVQPRAVVVAGRRLAGHCLGRGVRGPEAGDPPRLSLDHRTIGSKFGRDGR